MVQYCWVDSVPIHWLQMSVIWSQLGPKVSYLCLKNVNVFGVGITKFELLLYLYQYELFQLRIWIILEPFWMRHWTSGFISLEVNDNNLNNVSMLCETRTLGILSYILFQGTTIKFDNFAVEYCFVLWHILSVKYSVWY